MANKNKDDEPIANARDLYMTLYSTVFSHWPVVVVIAIVGVILFSMTVVSLFIPLFLNAECVIKNNVCCKRLWSRDYS